MVKVLAIGDTHSDTSSICNIAIPQARRNDCELIVQCGDFGFWEHVDDNRRFLDKVSKHLVREKVDLYWIDGNHENHPLLWEKYPPTTSEGLCEIRPRIWYIPRGTVFRVGTVTCLGLGGAHSIDKNMRLTEEIIRNRPGTLWWDTEMTRREDVEYALEQIAKHGPIDIMFTHDCPRGTDIPGIDVADGWRWPETWQNRERLREVFDVARPRLLVHGHYHVRYTSGIHWQADDGTLDGCRVEGLAHNGLWGFGIILDLDALFA